MKKIILSFIMGFSILTLSYSSTAKEVDYNKTTGGHDTTSSSSSSSSSGSGSSSTATATSTDACTSSCTDTENSCKEDCEDSGVYGDLVDIYSEAMCESVTFSSDPDGYTMCASIKKKIDAAKPQYTTCANSCADSFTTCKRRCKMVDVEIKK